MTATLSNLTGNDVMYIVCTSVRSILSTFSSNTNEADAVPMTLAVFEDPALGGFGEGFSGIYWLAAGDLVSASVTFEQIPSPNHNNQGRGMTVYAVEGILQTGSVHAIDSANLISGTSSSTRTVVKDATDFAVSCLTLSSRLTPSGSATMVIDGNVVSPGGDDAVTHAAAHIVPSEASGQFAWTFNGSSAFAVTLASFFEAPAPLAPVINDVDGGNEVEPDNLNLAVNGVDLFTTGITALYVADSTIFATANKQIQQISGVTTSTLNWDFINLGTVGEGARFLFVLSDAGGGSELISSAFAINIQSRDTHYTSRIYTTDGTTGVVNVVVDVEFDAPSFAIIRATANTALNTLESGSVSCICFVSGNTSMGMCAGAQVSPFEAYQRKRSNGIGSLIVMSGGDGGAADLVRGTPVMTDVGLDIDFIVNTPGVFLQITIFGGLSVQSALKAVEINDGSVSGFGFEADGVIAMTNGLPSGSVSDSTFALTCFGVAKNPGAAGDQWLMANNQQDTNKNCALIPGSLLAQISGSTINWIMSVTSFTADGITWSGTDGDYAHILAFKLPGMGFFVGDFTKESGGVNGTSEPLPDVGFEPGLLGIVTCARTDDGPAGGALGARWSQGAALPLNQGCKSIRQLPATSPTLPEQLVSTLDAVDCSSVSGSSTLVGRITTLAQISTIQWITNPAAAIKFCIFAVEATEDIDVAGESIVEDVAMP